MRARAQPNLNLNPNPHPGTIAFQMREQGLSLAVVVGGCVTQRLLASGRIVNFTLRPWSTYAPRSHIQNSSDAVLIRAGASLPSSLDEHPSWEAVSGRPVGPSVGEHRARDCVYLRRRPWLSGGGGDAEHEGA